MWFLVKRRCQKYNQYYLYAILSDGAKALARIEMEILVIATSSASAGCFTPLAMTRL